MKNLKKFILPAAATALVFSQSSCKKDDPTTPTEDLTGQWELTDFDGDLEDMFDNDYDLNLEFHLEGDAEFCMVESKYKFCYMGDWEWNNTEMTEIYMDLGDVEITVTIDTFEGDVINGEMTFEYDGEKYKGDVTLERVYIDKSALVSVEKSTMLNVEK